MMGRAGCLLRLTLALQPPTQTSLELVTARRLSSVAIGFLLKKSYSQFGSIQKTTESTSTASVADSRIFLARSADCIPCTPLQINCFQPEFYRLSPCKCY